MEPRKHLMHFRAAAFGALALILALHGCGPRSRHALMRSANRHWKKGKWFEACRMYERVLDLARSARLWQKAARLYVRCMARTGQLAEAKKKAEARLNAARDGAAYYLMAFVEVASGAGRLKQAESALRAALRLSGKGADPAYRLGLLLLEDERFHEAAQLLRKTVQKDDTRPGPRIAFARALAVTGRRKEALDVLRPVPDRPMTRAQVRRAEAVVGLVIEGAAPMTRRGMKAYTRAVRLMNRKLPGRASQVLEEAMKRHNPEPALHRLLGMAHLTLGNSALGVVHLRRALELNPADGRSAALLGAFLWSKGRRRGAERLLRIAVRTNPISTMAHAALGDLLLRSGRPEESASTLARAVHLSGHAIQTVRLWARALTTAGKWDKAEKVLRRTVRKHKEDYPALILLGDLYLKQYRKATDGPTAEGYYEKARKAFKRAIKLRPGDVPALQRLKSMDPKENGRSSP